jgi:hypothetical protein
MNPKSAHPVDFSSGGKLIYLHSGSLSFDYANAPLWLQVFIGPWKMDHFTFPAHHNLIQTAS